MAGSALEKDEDYVLRRILSSHLLRGGIGAGEGAIYGEIRSGDARARDFKEAAAGDMGTAEESPVSCGVLVDEFVELVLSGHISN